MENINLTYNDVESRSARVDDLGRISLPTEMRKKLNLKDDDRLNLVVATGQDGRPYLLGMQYGSLSQFERQCNQILTNLVTLAKQKGYNLSSIRIYDDAKRIVASEGTFAVRAIRSEHIADAMGKAVQSLLSDAGLDNIHSTFEPCDESGQKTAVFAAALRDQFTGTPLGALVLADTDKIVEEMKMAMQYASISFDGRRDG